MADKNTKSNDDIKINEEFSFTSKLGKSHIIKYKESLKNYFNNLDSAVRLQENNMPIFLDTDVLLKTYNISFKAREKLKAFFKKNSKRIHIVGQVQKEFTKNREGAIDKFYSTMGEELPKNLKNIVINKLQAFLDGNSVILKDYDFLEDKLKKIKKEYDTLYEKLKKEIERQKKSSENIKYIDDLLDIYSQFNLLDGLTDKEIQFLKKEFDELKKTIKDTSKKDSSKDTPKIDSQINKQYNSFPGSGDIKKKPDDPYGDFIIFHEILKYVKCNAMDVIFLTYDMTKGDWLHKDKKPHLHYIENIYLNTNKSIYILDAERAFKDLLKISLKPVYGEDEVLDYNPEYFIGSFVLSWSILEKDIRETSQRFNLNERRPIPITHLLLGLEVIDQEFMSEFSELKELRDKIVHGFYSSNDLSAEDENSILIRLWKLIDKIKNL